MQELFLNSEASVQSDRILYTPSLFARSALLNLQEVGSLKHAVHIHLPDRG